MLLCSQTDVLSY
ncbi:hypothetical protein S40285_10676 [Stachybotrys chlorohalonatus IBT 40285]|uniref:Uncharacterized protein n=1 Tax=Stachybotrys chlorohalonatus (strain IBT 40285) TaxID=1283841 RepID=A0A084R345_STAC4|nr:hypothetical protein S40285_10676 [Stachybotrys chlorohalonata IBT 40285]